MTGVWHLVSGPVLQLCMAGIPCYFVGPATTHRNRVFVGYVLSAERIADDYRSVALSGDSAG